MLKGGPHAFPFDPRLAPEAASLGDTIEGRKAARGMTLRDYYAGQALPALIADAYRENKGRDWLISHDEIAAKAYVIADAMLKERDR